MLVLDTHAAVWWVSEPTRLGRVARARLDSAEQLGIPAIVFWEIALLIRRRRLDLGIPVENWMRTVQRIPRVETLPLTAEIAVEADALAMHADPADRFIVATALHHQATLVSKDRLMQALPLLDTIW